VLGPAATFALLRAVDGHKGHFRRIEGTGDESGSLH